MMEDDYEDFEKCTNCLFDGDLWDIECNLGLWSVQGCNQEEVQDEALHYFRQYKSDGEYYKILGGDSPTKVLNKHYKTKGW